MSCEVGLKDVVLVGGGAGAVATLSALLEHGSVRSLTIVDPAEVGVGQVFGARFSGDCALLTNTPVGLMYINENRREDFARFLEARGLPMSVDDFPPRYLFGDFLREEYAKLRAEAERRMIAVRHVRARVETIARTDGGYRLHLNDGDALSATDVVLAVGFEQPILPAMFDGLDNHPRLFLGCYPPERLAPIPAGSHVLVLGMRASAQDATYLLGQAGSSVVLASRSGRLSAVRDRMTLTTTDHLDRKRWLALDPDDPEIAAKAGALLLSALDKVSGGVPVSDQLVPPSGQASRLRAEMALAESGKAYWNDLAFEGLALLNELMGRWGEDARKRLAPLFQEILTRYIGALPLPIAKRLLDGVEEGRITISDAAIEAAVPSGDGWDVRWSDGRNEFFDAIVATVGFNAPRFPMIDDDTLRVSDASAVTPDTRLVTINEDLSVSFGEGAARERIWALGVGSTARYPFATINYLTVQQAGSIAARIMDARGAYYPAPPCSARAADRKVGAFSRVTS